MNPYLKQYQKSNLETASPEKILIMLYDGAIQFLNIARIEMTSDSPNKDIQKIHNNIIGAQKIITEFQSTLNMEIGGDVAKNLYALYDYLYNRLVTANIKKDLGALDEVLKHMRGLRDTWQQAIEIAAKEKASKTISEDSEDVEYEHSEETV